jgi:hypothetical protein
MTLEKKNGQLKGLIVLFEPLVSPIIQSQIMLLAKDLRCRGVDFEIWVLEGRRKWRKSNIENLEKAKTLSQSQVRAFQSIFFPLPFSCLINAFILTLLLMRYKLRPDFIHARTDYSACVCGIVSLVLNIPVVWDCRGHSVAEMKTLINFQNFILKIGKIALVLLTRFRGWIAAKTCAAANFVSDDLRQHMMGPLRTSITTVIPCAVPSGSIYFSAKLRTQKRSELGYQEDDVVLLYSGGMAKYQSFKEYVALVKKLAEYNNHIKFLVVTHEPQKALQELQELPAYLFQLTSANIQDMNAFYCAADYGMLIRENNLLNNVASPTKFAEYCLAGLPIIMNDSVHQSWEYAKEIGNLVNIEELSEIDLYASSAKERCKIAQLAHDKLSRSVLLERYLQLYQDICAPHSGERFIRE